MEKTLLKVSGIVAIIVGIGWCFTIIGIIVGVLLIIGGASMMGYSGLNDSEIVSKKNAIMGWSIFFLFFTVIAGILGLIFYFNIDNKIFTKKSTYVDELKELDELRKKGIISEEEYETKKKKILDI